MKIFFITLSLAVFFVFPAFVSAETNAGIKPGSFWYGFDLAFEKINLFFALSPQSKARKALEYADERLAERAAVIKNDNAKVVEKAVTNSVGAKEQKKEGEQVVELGNEIEQLKKEVEGLKKKSAVDGIQNQQIFPVVEDVQLPLSNAVPPGILCNGKYWAQCLTGQKFYCPRVGEARCVVENTQPSSLSPGLQSVKNCLQWALETYEREKDSLNIKYEECKVEHPGIDGLVLCGGILKSPTDYSSSCGVGSSGSGGSIYSPSPPNYLPPTSFSEEMRKREMCDLVDGIYILGGCH